MRNDETTTLAKQAFWKLLMEGKSPTVDQVNDWFLVSGHEKRNRNAISAALKTCWSELGQRVKQMRHIPDIPAETVDLVLALRDSLMKVATSQFNDERREFEAYNAAAGKKFSEETTSLKDTLASVAAKEQLALEELQVQTMQCHVLETKILAQSNVMEQNAQVIASLEVASSANEQKLNAAQHQIEDMQSSAALLKASEAERFKAMQHSLQRQIDDERVRINNLAKQIEKQDSTITSLRTEGINQERALLQHISTLTGDIGKMEGMNAVLQQQLTHAQGEAAKRVESLSAAAAQIASLKAANALLLQQSPAKIERMLEDAYVAGAGSQIELKSEKKPTRTALEASRPNASAYAAKVMSRLPE